MVLDLTQVSSVWLPLVLSTQKSTFMKWISRKLLTGRQNASWVHSHFKIVSDLLKVRLLNLLRKNHEKIVVRPRFITSTSQVTDVLMVNFVSCAVNQSGVRGVFGSQYHLLASDLQALDKLESNLMQAGVTFSLPTLLLAECAICYMDEAR